MLFFYVRHGDPIYDPDSLTPLGHRQAAAVAKRLALYGLDRIYASTSNRAIETARPTCEMTRLEMQTLDFCHEGHAWDDFTAPLGEQRAWLFQHPEVRRLFVSEELLSLGERWYEHPAFGDGRAAAGVARVRRESDAFFASLGYEHIGIGAYRVVKPNDERVALFAHQGFGLAFLSTLLDIPYPRFCMHFDMCHTGVTAIEFSDENGIAVPRVLTLSSDSHLYREGIANNYNYRVRF